MYNELINESLIFQLRNIAFLSFTRDFDYSDIISPFTRMYLITEGHGCLIIGDHKTILEAGNLYLIPSFTSCTYHFGAGLSHYYIHLSIDHPNGLSPFNMYSFTNKTQASELDYLLFKRIQQINPGLQLPHPNPNVYQTKLWLSKKVTYQSVGQHLETLGVLEQIFSRFIKPGENHTMNSMLKYNIQPILLYIQNNLEQDIKVEELANMACFSKDHFSKVFKSITGMPPCDYIIRKRIERTQFLLLTTDLNLNEIIEQTGFKSASYFSRIFKKITSYSPAKYRLQGG
ncbi:MAG: AraC family transcriptional regulator [Bacteroidota bacterium]|nr:AraC family transcriptional regulator [Bacteroidota bacterium]MDP4273033.1 AraC family transcriptional regulator [Bacteroidota bacterium]